MENASNGFEHGYMSVDEVRGLLDDVLEQSMRLVRRALIQASGVGEAMRARLLAERYEEPRGLVPVIRFAQGQLSRVDDTRSPPVMDGAPVEVEWDVKQLAAENGPDGKLNIAWSTNLTATKLPENSQIEAESFGLRAAHLTASADPPVVEVNRADRNSADDEAP